MTDYLSSDERRRLVTALNEYLADTTVTYFKTHGFHWNVEGANFYSLHLMFEKFYEQLWEYMDEVAERIRSFGEKAPPNLAGLLKMASISEAQAAPTGHIMVANLQDDYIELARKAYEVGSLAEQCKDRVTTDIMTQHATFLEKAAWMLRSTATG